MGDEDLGQYYDGDTAYQTAVGLPPDYSASSVLPGDVSDQQQMGGWNPPAAQAQGVPWWGGIAAYGITRAIDNQFPGSPTGIHGNVYPGSMGGYNGRTYTVRPIGAGGGVARGSVGGTLNFGGNPMMLLVLVGAAVLLLK